jgi:magnesium transporter
MKKESSILFFYPKNSVARKMVEKDSVPVVFESQTISEALKYLEERIHHFETINYFYAVNSERKLVGVVSIKEIFSNLKSPETKISEIMEKKMIMVFPDTHPEKVALLAIKHSLKAIPVVRKDRTLFGVVPSDVILNILHEESTKDILQSAGIGNFKNGENDMAKKIIGASSFVHFKKRLPWLLVGLAGGIMAVFIVGFFEQALKTYLILAFFIPLVVYIADAVGAQTQTLYIRSIALNSNLPFSKYIKREAKVGLALALFLGLAIMIFSMLWWKIFVVGVILGISIFITVIASMAVAIFLPWFFEKSNYDPAIASGPFATVVRDIMSLLIYFGVAQIMLSIFA